MRRINGKTKLKRPLGEKIRNSATEKAAHVEGR
jgi:hypothetical protein